MMKKAIFVLLSFILTLNVYSQGFEKDKLKKLDTDLETIRTDWDIPGMAVAIVKDGKTIFAEGYGLRKAGSNEKVDANTLFGIASLTKAFTSASLAILVDQGKIDWDDKVQDYLPWFELYDPYVSANITIRDLLSHRSGLRTFSGDLLWYGTTYSREEIIRRAKYLKPAYGFREHYGYSNIMYLTAGQIIEAVTDTTWEDYVQHHFLTPLGMDRSSTTIEAFDQQDNIATPHNLVLGANYPIEYISWQNIAPAGAVNSSVQDMTHWIKMHLNRGEYKGKRYFSEQVSYDMWQPVTPFEISKQSESLWPSMHWRAYGLGWGLFEYQGRKVVNHSGGLDGVISRVFLVPEENMGFIVLTNNINGLTSWLGYEILDRYFDGDERDWPAYGLQRSKAYEERKAQQQQEFLASKKENAPHALPLEAYAGTYGGKMYGNAEVRLENGKLVLDFLPTPIFIGDLEHFHFNTFTIQLRDAPSLPEGTVQFVLDKEGNVEEMKVDIPNPDFHFTELKFNKL